MNIHDVLSQVDAARERATQGEWECLRGFLDVPMLNPTNGMECGRRGYPMETKDAAYTALLHNSYPTIRSHIEALEGEVERLTKRCEAAEGAIREVVSIFECTEFTHGHGPSNDLMNRLHGLEG